MNRFHFFLFLFLLLTQVNARFGWLLLHSSVALVIFICAQQKLLSSHTKIGAAGGVGEGGGSNNSINIILFYDFPQYLLGNNSLRVMRDMILFLISSIDDPTISLPNMINSSLFQDIGKEDLEPFFHSFVI